MYSQSGVHGSIQSQIRLANGLGLHKVHIIMQYKTLCQLGVQLISAIQAYTFL